MFVQSPLPSRWEALDSYLGPEWWVSALEEVTWRRCTETIYPPVEDVFNAFKHCSLEEVSVVLLGQDPYHGPGQAHGLAFSFVGEGRTPPSVQNLFKELHSDLQGPLRTSCDLTDWAQQGILLLNTVLTVAEGQPKSHCGIGWEEITNTIISYFATERADVIFLALGNDAKKQVSAAGIPPERVISAAHPSPLAAYRGFFGSKVFSTVNDRLVAIGKEPINWG
jgi:uracil-DNA glycosylase